MATLTKPVVESRLRAALDQALGRIEIVSDPADARVAKECPPGQGTETRILVVEDDSVNLEVALALLFKQGYRADGVVNGAEALAAIDNTVYDVVLMDCEMPEMDGFEATRRIRAQEERANSPEIPIIAITAHGMPGDESRCLRAGMNDYLLKPFEAARLIEKLNKWLPNPLRVNAVKPEDHGVAGETFQESDLLDCLSGDHDLARRLVTEFLKSAPSCLRRISERLAISDVDGLQKEAHRLKGTAATMAAPSLRDVARDIELAAKARNVDRVRELMPLATDQLERFAAALKNCDWASAKGGSERLGGRFGQPASRAVTGFLSGVCRPPRGRSFSAPTS